MNIIQAVKTCTYNNYANFRGYASRSEFWYFHLFVWLLGTVCTVLSIFIAFSIFDGQHTDITVSVCFFTCLSLWALLITPYIAVFARRLRDAGHSPWHVLSIPAGFSLLALFIFDGIYMHMLQDSLYIIVFAILGYRIILLFMLMQKSKTAESEQGGQKEKSPKEELGGDMVI